MPFAPRFLVVDFNADSRSLLVRTLHRKYPDAEFVECDEADSAVAHACSGTVTAIITHRTFDSSGADLVRTFRNCNRQVPIVMVSGVNRASDARDAGADCFLHYDEWLRIGTVVDELLQAREASGSASPIAISAKTDR